MINTEAKPATNVIKNKKKTKKYKINDSNYDPCDKYKDKPWKCTHPGCNKRFKHDSNLRIHSVIHTPNALVCNYCQKKFARNSNLKQHLRVHTGERPYSCNVCGHSFKQKHSLKDHMRIHLKMHSFVFLLNTANIFCLNKIYIFRKC